MLHKSNGGAFLIEDVAPDGIFTAEDPGEEHLAVARTVDEFWTRDVEPRLEAIRRQEPGAAVEVLRKSAELGLTGVTIPEEFGGMGMDLASAIVVAEHLARDGSYAICHEVHTGIGSMPILYFGTQEQKARYLPKLAAAKLVAAYALSEAQSGSDALAVRTRADLSPDGRHYLLNGQKMWITNGGIADLFTVFAKVGGEKFTAFLVERRFPGVTTGAEERKMGIKGSSTTALYLDNVPVPVENVLGEVGRGHVIAFNILNSGRLKIGVLALGGAKHVLGLSLKYAKQRKAFGASIAEFGAIRHKLAEMAIRIYAAESMLWRVAGLLQSLAGSDMLKALEEYVVECSMLKVYCSEVYDFVADEGVQIHGGYGYHQDYDVERAYRDSRINRIYEGTNEINRLIIPTMLLKRAARGRLNLLPVAAPEFSGDEEPSLVQRAKQIALLALDLVRQRFQNETEKQQELLMSIADIVMEVFAMESSLLRSRKFAPGKGENATAMCTTFLRDALARVETSARDVLGACLEGASLHAQMTALRGLADCDPVDAVGLRRAIAGRLLARERYVV
ncbi:MAG: acyl-CoA dehydrogenase family protein [Bryobacteraceae bacterium]